MSLSVQVVFVLMAPTLGGIILVQGWQSVQTPVTCDAGQFVEGSNATVVCHFDQVKQLAAFTLLHYPVDLANGAEKTALVCLRSQGGEVFCQKANGYFLDPSSANLTADLVTIEIRAVTFDQAGYYACHTIPPEESVTVNWCRLTVRVRSRTDFITTSAPEKLQAEYPCCDDKASNASTCKDIDTLALLASCMVMVYIL